MAIKLHPSFAAYPGPWLRTEVVGPHGLSVTDTGRKLHVTRQAMSNLLGNRVGLSAERRSGSKRSSGWRPTC